MRPRLIRAFFFVFRKSGWAAGDIATNIDDILGCGEPGFCLLKAWRSWEKRSGALNVQEKASVRVGMALARSALCAIPP